MNLSLSLDIVKFLPLCPVSWWVCLRIKVETWWFLRRITGCLASACNADWCNRPPTLKIPSCTARSSLTMWMLLLSLSQFWGVLSSSLKLWLWQINNLNFSTCYIFGSEQGSINSWSEPYAFIFWPFQLSFHDSNSHLPLILDVYGVCSGYEAVVWISSARPFSECICIHASWCMVGWILLS